TLGGSHAGPQHSDREPRQGDQGQDRHGCGANASAATHPKRLLSSLVGCVPERTWLGKSLVRWVPHPKRLLSSHVDCVPGARILLRRGFLWAGSVCTGGHAGYPSSPDASIW
ncbi:MAG: hypothetical protein ACM362_03190, partial [Candidatus Methylomirabilota bacterium]